MLQEFNIGFNLTGLFNIKKSTSCIPNLSSIEHILEYKYY